MMKGNYYTITDLARELKIPESTARYHRDRFPEYFHATVVGKKRYYSKDMLRVLDVIIAESLRNKSTAEISQALNQEFEPIIEIATQAAAGQQQDIFLANQAVKTAIVDIKNILETLSSQVNQNSQLQNEIAELRNELRELKEMQLQGQKKGFFDRLFGK